MAIDATEAFHTAAGGLWSGNTAELVTAITGALHELNHVIDNRHDIDTTTARIAASQLTGALARIAVRIYPSNITNKEPGTRNAKK